jgi:uncharacterized membrane protein
VTSVSILPSVIALVSGLDGVSIFRFIFPVIYSMLPVLLYQVYRKVVTPRIAFGSVFLFMSFPSFYVEMISLARQEVAEFILVILSLIFLSPRIGESRSKDLIVAILTFGLIAAHYTLAYLYILLLIFGSAVSAVFRRRDFALCSTETLALTAVVCLAWYVTTAGGVAIAILIQNIIRVTNGVVQGFLSQGTRPTTVTLAYTFGGLAGPLHDINRVTLYLAQFLLLLGFVELLRKRDKSEGERKMLPLMTVAFGFLASAVLLPYFAGELQLSRIYSIALLFVSPCFLYGIQFLDSLVASARSLVRYASHVRLPKGVSLKSIFTVAILLSYFLFSSGWVWAVSGDRATSTVLDYDQMFASSDQQVSYAFFAFYTVPGDVAGARWIQAHDSNYLQICADWIARYHVLTSYGGFSRDGPMLPGCYGYFQNSYIFLSEFNNVRDDLSTGSSSTNIQSISNISALLDVRNRVYSGGAVIYQ